MHYVYYLHRETDGELLYIGRSIKPRVRQTSFHSRTGVRTTMGFCQRFQDFDMACRAELSAIERHRPPFNKVLVSSPGALGHSWSMSLETRKRMSDSHVGVPKSGEHKSNISRGHLGKVLTEEHKANIRKAKLNVSDETRAKIGAASLGRSWSEASKEKLRATRRLKKLKGGT